MFGNRRIVSFNWRSGVLQNLVVISKRSDVVGPQCQPYYLKTRISSGTTTALNFSTTTHDLQTKSLSGAGNLCFGSKLSRITVFGGFSSTYYPLPGSTSCNQKIKQVNTQIFSLRVYSSLMMNGQVEQSSEDNSSGSKSCTRKHSGDNLPPRKHLKTGEMVRSDATTEAVAADKSKNDAVLDGENTKSDCVTLIRSHRMSMREQLICHRLWEMTKKGKKFYSSYDDLSHTVYEFSIASYNVLAQNLLTENEYLYRNCDKRCLKWDFRKNLLLQELKKHNPDILCLQEVNEDHYEDFFKPQLECLGYDGAYKKRTGKRKDGCATFYKKDKFDCQLTHPVEYLTPEVPLLDRDNVALVLLLQPKHFSRSLDTAVCVANTHLLFNPRRGDVKLAQLMILFAVIDKLVYRPSSLSDLTYHPVVLCGDFNMEPFSNLYSFVRSGSLECDGTVIRNLSGQESENGRGSNKCLEPEFLSKAAGITDQCQYLDVAMQRMERNLEARRAAAVDLPCGMSADVIEKMQMIPKELLSQGSGRIRHRLGIRSVYEHVRPKKTNGDELEVTTFHNNACCTVDYIFYSSAGKREKKKVGGVAHSGGSHLELMSRLKLLSEEEMERVGKLPNDLNASDHTILMAKFSFKL